MRECVYLYIDVKYFNNAPICINNSNANENVLLFFDAFTINNCARVSGTIRS